MKRRIKRSIPLKHKSCAVTLCAAMVLTGTGSIWRPWRTSAGPATREAAKASAPKSAPPEKPGTPIQATSAPRKGPLLLHFALYDAGIYPGEVHARQGPVRLALEDYSGGTPGLVLANADTGVQLTVVKRDRDSWRGLMDVTLQPGRYVLQETGSPARQASIVIDP